MKTTKKRTKMSSADRRAAIVEAVRRVFVEKGFHGTTTRELAKAAGVSEALMFRHFPNKEALYAAIQKSCFKEEGSKIVERLESLEPSTATLVFLVDDLVSHVLQGPPDDEGHQFLRLILRSLMDEGEFTRLATQTGPARWVKTVTESIKAARRAGDIVDRSVRTNLAGWLVHQLTAGILLHSLPRQPVVDYGVSSEELMRQIVLFCLRGIGLKDEAIRRYFKAKRARGA
jgi:AcrR family transcriptional regulator